MLKKTSKRRGSALLLAVVIVILVAGLAGAFLTLTASNSKKQFQQSQSDDAQQICDAALEMARAALLQWRNADIDTQPPGPALNPQCYAWNKIFTYCDAPTMTGSMGAAVDADTIKADALARFKSNNWAYTSDASGYNYDTTNTPQTIGSIGSPLTTTIGQGVRDLFCINRRYGKGAFHLIMKNNLGDRHGDGIDNQVPSSGNPWRFDPPQSTTNTITNVTTVIYTGDLDTLGSNNPTVINNPTNWGTGSGRYSPYIDGDGQAILVVTATLPDGTMHQIEVLIGYPFTAGGPLNAIQDNGDISMQGNFKVLGTLGNVMANGNITGNGSNNAQVSGAVNAAGSNGLTMGGTQPPGGINSGVSPINIDPIDVSLFLTDPKYAELRNKMYIFNANGTAQLIIGNGSPVNVAIPSGWQYQGGQWGLKNTGSPPEATYFINGDLKMTGNQPDLTATLITTGSLEMGGNSKFTASHYADASGNITTKPTNQLAVAGADVKLTGNGVTGNYQYNGSVWANEQVKIQGTFDLNGSITGANAADTPGSAVSSGSQVSDPDLTIGGTPTITYNGGGSIIKQSADHLDVKQLNRTR